MPKLNIHQIAALCRLYKCSIEELEQAVQESMAKRNQNEETNLLE
jgi:putative transcriptional regulator